MTVSGMEQRVGLREAQARDPVISRVMYFMKKGTQPSVKESRVEPRGVQRLLLSGTNFI